MSYTVCLAQPKHFPSLASIERETSAAFPSHLLPADARAAPRSTLEEAQAEARLWVAVTATGESVGFAVAECEGDAAFLLKSARTLAALGLTGAVLVRLRSGTAS